jgi:hypothetical protein
MEGQSELFSVIEIEDDLLLKICRVLGIDKNEIYDDPYNMYAIDQFVCDSIRDYMRRYTLDSKSPGVVD